MKPTDLDLFRCYGRPALAASGDVFAALVTPDLATDSYRSVIHRLRPGADPVPFTHGPRDSAPALSPDGATLLFLRAAESGPGQIFVMPTAGGEPRRVADHPLGASAVTFSPDGRSIAYLAAVPEPGRYGTPPIPDPGSGGGATAPAADAEAPRRISEMSYRSDGKGFVLDRPEQVFALRLFDEQGGALPDSEPRQLTAEPVSAGRPVFTPDGREVLYSRRVTHSGLREEIAAVPVDAPHPAVGRTVVTTGGDAANPVVAGDTVYYVGSAFDGNDFAGRNNGLWAAPLTGGEPRRMTDPQTVHVDPVAGEPLVVGEIGDVGETVLIPVAERGCVTIRAVPVAATAAALADLPAVVSGRRVVRALSGNGKRITAVVADPASAGDIVTVDLAAALGNPAAVPSGTFTNVTAETATDVTAGTTAQTVAETVLTDVSRLLRESGIAPIVELAGVAPDGYPVHGWLVLPPESFVGPHPVLLDVHGGPHAAYTWAVFDEAQMYATNGYAVVLPNPRGSAGYGQDHGRAIVGRLGTVDADDVLALLDAALARDDLDGRRVGVMGGSYGGFMTSWLASHAPGRFAAGISERAVNAWDSFAGTSDIGFFFADGYVGADRDEQWARSPLAHADRIDVPLLIIHSEQDWRCPVEQAQRLFVALRGRDHDAEMLLFPGEGHELSRSGRPRHRRQRFDAILDWWRRYLPVE